MVPGGTIFVDSTLIQRKVQRTDVRAVYIPATRLAQQNGFSTLANMILIGKVMKETGFVSYDGIEEAVRSVVSAKHEDLYEINLKAVQIGYSYQE